jgi:geranylgeranyl reductase family protein
VHDVVIVGAGPGGSAAAHYLARRGLDVLLLDKSGFPRNKTCGDGLTPRAVAVLDDMGILDDLLRVGQRIGGVEIFAPDGYATEAPIPSSNGLPACMLVVPRVILDNAIRERAVRSGAQFEGDVLVTELLRSGPGVVIRAQRGGHPLTITARMAIVATGASVALLVRSGLLRSAPPVIRAARTYFEGIHGLTDRIHIRFDGVPLPGYGWIFPTSASSANVGVGFFPRVRWSRRRAPTPRTAFDGFIQSRALAAMLTGARRDGPVEAYPLRVDFPAAPTFGDRVLLVGEAAGLVNPLTGEGIDYALESAQIASEHVARLFDEGDLSLRGLTEYDRLLRERFERLFAFCRRVRDVSANALLLNRLVRIASYRDDLKMLLVNIVLGHHEASRQLSLRAILQKAFSLAR